MAARAGAWPTDAIHPVLIRDPNEQEEMLRPEADDWTGRTIGSLLEIPEVLAALDRN